MKKLGLYPVRPIVGRSFEGCKEVTVPSQSLSLKEILRRFVRREPLPVMKDASYNEAFGVDIEKLAKLDITEQMEVVDKLKKSVKRHTTPRKKEDDPVPVPSSDAPVPVPDAPPKKDT